MDFRGSGRGGHRHRGGHRRGGQSGYSNGGHRDGHGDGQHGNGQHAHSGHHHGSSSSGYDSQSRPGSSHGGYQQGQGHQGDQGQGYQSQHQGPPQFQDGKNRLDYSPPALAAKLDPATRAAVDAYVAKWGPALQAEVDAEAAAVRERLEAWPLARLQREGLVLTGLAGRKFGSYFGKVVLRMSAGNGDDLPFHRFGSGDLVTLCRGNPLRERTFEALVMDRSRREVRLVADAPPPGLSEGAWRLDKGVNMTLYMRCAAALRSLYRQEPGAGSGEGAMEGRQGQSQDCEGDEGGEGGNQGYAGSGQALPDAYGGRGGYGYGGRGGGRGRGQWGRGGGGGRGKRARRQEEEEDEGLPEGTFLRDVLMASQSSPHPQSPGALAALISTVMPPQALQWASQHLPSDGRGAAPASTQRGRGPLPPSPAPRAGPCAAVAGAAVGREAAAVEDERVGLNASQEAGVALAMRHRVVLLQGPPGTGKTTTIIRLLVLLKRVCGLPGPILAAAQSNTAVDNLLEGAVDAGLNAVRVGQPVKVRESLRDATLDARLLGHPLQAQIDEASARLRDHLRRLPSMRGRDRGLGHRDASIMGKELKSLREALTREVLGGAEVICATCVGAGGEQLSGITFPVVVIDEGSQATEPEVLIPLTKGCAHVVLVGDHCQLPPVVLSDVPGSGQPHPLSLSLFERLINAAAPSALLQVQYRMHPALSAFPSARFYGGALVDGVAPAARPLPPGLPWPAPAHGPLMMVDVRVGREATSSGGSKSNAVEAEVAVAVVVAFMRGGMAASDIGLITPYVAQVQVLSDGLQRWAGAKGVITDGVEVKSVDGYQGREKEVIVFSCVRANAQGSVGFLSDWRRLNVGVTRARRGLVVLGHADTLRRGDPTWAALVDHCQSVGCIVDAQRLMASLGRS